MLLGGVLDPRGGLLGLANLLVAHLAIAASVFIPVLILTRSRSLAMAFGVLAVVVAIRFGDEWLSMPVAGSGDPDLRVATWNLEFGAVGIEAGLDGLRILQTAGIGLLANRPLAEVEAFADPVGMRAMLDLDGEVVVIHTAHPYPASIGTVSGLRIPIAYDPTARDEAITRVRERMAADLLGVAPVVLVGDFNVAPTEPAYTILARGLVDAHRAIGNGTGWTWRPSRFEGLGLGLLRIDYVMSRGLDPLAIATDCSRPGDHCLVAVDLGWP